MRGKSPGDESLTLTRCHSCGLPELYDSLEGGKSICGRAHNLKGRKVENFSKIKNQTGRLAIEEGDVYMKRIPREGGKRF